ncbi:MAG: PorT family protein [bacterium]|nr:PorT family protein [bacterium]
MRIFLKYLFAILLIITTSASFLYAGPDTEEELQKEQSPPNLAIGLGGSFGLTDVWIKDSPNVWGSGIAISGGLVLEKMFTNRVGIHSGVWYSRFKNQIYLSNSSLQTTVTSQNIGMPFYLLTSFNAGFFSLNLLTGVGLNYIFTSTLSGGPSDADVLESLAYFQVEAAAGINFKFRLGKHFDFFIGGMASMGITKLHEERSSENVRLYHLRGISGFLIRTDIFPGN